jgi:Fe-Mn family superoxide dismutase
MRQLLHTSLAILLITFVMGCSRTHTDHRLFLADSLMWTAPDSALHILNAINRDFGSVEAFKAEFEQKGTTLFGSGWVWLAADKDGKLVITQEPNAGNPVTKGLKPLLTMDVWEHAYYIDYRNRRAAHLQSLWQMINWDEINRRYTE